MKIPQHVAIILDGNGRWAQQRNKPRTYGHQKGMDIVKDVASYAKELGIKYLTVFCFSTENWNRPKDEVDFLMNTPAKMFSEKNIKKYNDQNIKIEWIGRKTKIPEQTRKVIENAIDKTKENNGLTLTVALDYGSQEELVTAIKSIYENIANISNEMIQIDYNLVKSNLYTANIPEVDLLIRTGGEKRLSNYLLLQSAYAELYFTDIYWPDFNNEELDKAIKDYNGRDRRYGGIK